VGPVDIEIRAGRCEDVAELAWLDGISFGFDYVDYDITDLELTLDPGRFLVATEGDDIVGIAGDYPFTMTVPGGFLAVPGVTWVSVRPTHRRRGILRHLMDRQLREYAERGEIAAILTASEGGIYHRFGYGPATVKRRTVLDRTATRWTGPMARGSVRLATAAQARAHVPDVHRRWCAHTPGALSRSKQWWDGEFLDRESHRNGATARRYLLHDDGYVIYRTRSARTDGRQHNACHLTDYVALTADAHAGLWQVLLGLDLVTTINAHSIPIDDPLAFLLSDGRQLRTTDLDDGIWVRLLDVASALAARNYGVELDVVIEVQDSTFGTGRYRLRGGPQGASCRRTDAPADVFCDVAALGSVYLGGHRVSQLAAAGGFRAQDLDVLRRLDLAFLADRAPSYGTDF
jgi:predicted acetyltransferase